MNAEMFGSNRKEWLTWGQSWLTEPLFTIGDVTLSIANVLKMLFFLVLVIWVGRLVRRILARRVFPRAHVEPAMGAAISTVVFYIFVSFGMIVGLQASGIDLSTLTVLFGAVGVGIGFGLQNIAANFVSGLVILFEQPIRINDRIQIGDLHGRVVRIRARATEILTNDGIAVIVPNSDFISQRVINWSLSDDKIRIKVPVGVAYGSDPRKVREVLLEAAANVGAVLKEPSPNVRLKSFADSAIEFELLGWTQELLQARGEFISRVNFAVHEALKRNGIAIPFPQRDLHLKTAVPIPVATGESPEPGRGRAA